MRAPQHQRVHILSLQFLKIPGQDLIRDAVVQKAFLHQRHQQGTRLAEYADIGVQPVDHFPVNVGVHGPPGPDDTDASILCGLYRRYGAGIDHSDHRDVALPGDRLQCKGAGRIAGDHNSLHAPVSQEPDDLTGIADDCLP